MQLIAGQPVFAASDLTDDLECRHLTALERLVAARTLVRPPAEPSVELISRKGTEHEQRYLDLLRGRHGAALVELPERLDNTLAAMRQAEADTQNAMAAGAKVVYQATFFDGTFLGRADFLRRIETPSARWAWSYEVLDTKLALSPKPYFLVQLCNYSEHVARLQGAAPEEGAIVLGSGLERRFRLADYGAYYRQLKRSFLARFAAPQPTYPDECAHCAVCRWASVCEAQREADEHLGLVAGMRGEQMRRLHRAGITTLQALAEAGAAQRPVGMAETTFDTLRRQAALQARQRRAIAANVPGAQRYFYEFREHEPRTGFELLVPPDEGDVFFDMEGDPLYAPGRGLEYLFGVYLPASEEYRAFWARDGSEERTAFELLIDFLVERRRTYPEMHVYHYAPYETSALRRLMGRYGTREDELDGLLRAEVFVDSYAVVRQSLRISQPSYSIKKLEAFYGMRRTANVRRGDDSILLFETWLSSRDDTILEDIRLYNEEDCRSTLLLRDWLLERRAERGHAMGCELPWRPQPPERIELAVPQSDLASRLLEGLSAPETLEELRTYGPAQRARWLLGHLLGYHRREAKPAWWKMFDRRDNPDRLTEFDHEAIGEVRLCTDVAPYKLKPGDRNSVYTYAFPEQRYNLGQGQPWCPALWHAVGDVVAIDDDRNRIAIKVGGGVDPVAVRALIPGGPVRTQAQEAALERIAQAFLDGSLASSRPAVYDLLLARTPRLRDRVPGMPIQPASIAAAAVSALVAALDRSYLFIQGPPGSGKTTIGAAVIADLLAAGKRVGVMSRSHKAIHHLLHKVEAECERRGTRCSGCYKASLGESAYVSALASPMIASVTEHAAMSAQPHALAGGTSWYFARPEVAGRYDVLFIDEAGQIALADALACAPAAENVVLLGDPLQLAQVSQGAHPVGTDRSILEHLLDDAPTVPEERGVFLDVSYRMHPAICRFVSELVYTGRLHAAPATAANRVDSPLLAGAGLRFVSCEHAGNGRASDEEAQLVADSAALLLRGNVSVGGDPSRPFTAADILVVTPYNAQRRLIARRLEEAGVCGVRVGTVDTFQGQEAPVVFYSMATSSGEELPRDAGFLFEKNRFNVAISRAQCLSVLVCSPRLFDVSCATIEEMALVNVLCAFAEAAKP